MNKLALLALSASGGLLSLSAIVSKFGAQPLPGTVSPATTKIPSSAKAAVSAPTLVKADKSSKVVDAANAFLATLSPQQQTTVQVGLAPQYASRWSNFPAAVVQRNGLFFRDLNAKQVDAALQVARLALSKEGFNRFQEIRATDNAFGKSEEAQRGPGGGGPRDGGGPGASPSGGPGKGGPGRGGSRNDAGGGVDDGGVDDGPFRSGPGESRGPGGPGSGSNGGGPGGGGFGSPQDLFGQGNYIIAFLGKPSKTTPWLLQLGGHHLAFNVYYKGEAGAATPYFVGVQPNIWKDAVGKTHEPLAPMRNAMHDLVSSLNPEQLKRARLEARFDDVYVGPGQDGKFPAQSEGIEVAGLSVASKNLVKRAIDAWIGDSVQAAAYRKRYFAELNQTKVAYSGATALKDTGDYVRIDGPHVWIEFACQASNHYHTIWRDRATDYGAAFDF